MKNLLFALILLLLHQLALGQAAPEWINVNNPFVTPTPIPQFKPGNYIEIVYQLNRQPSPIATAPNDWVSVTDIIAVTLIAEISVGAKTYKAEFPGVALVDGKFKFKLYGPDFDPLLVIRHANWQLLVTRLNYKIKGNPLTTTESNFPNAAFQSAGEGNISVTQLTYNINTKEFGIDLVASSNILSYKTSQILTNMGGTVIAKFLRVDGDVTAVDNSFTAHMTLSAQPGFDIVSIAKSSGGRVFLKIMAASASNPSFAEFSGLFPVSFDQDFVMDDIEGNESFGLNEMALKGSTSLPASDLKMVFLDNPSSEGIIPEIIGVPTTRNKFDFILPTSKINFQYGSYRVKFEGKDMLGKTIILNEKNPILIRKTPLQSINTTIEQADGKCYFSISFDKESPGDPKLVFTKTGDTRALKKEGQKFSTIINLSDAAIKDNLNETGAGNKILNVVVNAYGKDYSPQGIPVVVIDKQQAAEDLEKITGTKKVKREKIEQYLKDKNFVGDTEKMTETIFAELSKEKKDRNWSATWTQVGKFLKPLAGLVMLLI